MARIETRYQRLKRERAQRRSKIAHRAWARLSLFCKEHGVRAKLCGSIPEGRNDEYSDLDVMVFGDIPDDLMRSIIREARYASSSEQIPIDLFFERDYPDLPRWEDLAAITAPAPLPPSDPDAAA